MTDEPDPSVVEEGEERAGLETTPPLLRVVAGDPTPEELAALVAVVASLGAAAAAPPRRTPAWQAHHRKVRAPHHPGPAGWRSSGLPR